MFEHAQKAIELAEKLGADEAEVYISYNHSISADIRKNTIESAKENVSQGIGIRSIINGAVGFASTNNVSRIEDIVNISVSSAKVRESDPEWTSLPSNAKYPAVSGTYDKKISEIGLDDCIGLTGKMIEGALSVPDVNTTSGSFSTSYNKHLIMNTNGVEIVDEGTGVSGFVDVITTKGDLSTAYDFEVSRSLDIDVFGIGASASSLAIRSQNGISIEPKKTNVILHPFAFSDIFENTFEPSIDADNMQKERSSLIGKKGETIATSDLNIIDDGLLEGGIETSISDEEGTPSQRTPIIENGIFKSFLYDNYTAGKDNTSSTGNGMRHSYVSSPSVGPRNLIVEYPSSDVIADTDEGVFINTVIGAHTANAISGDFSVEARNAFTIKDGQLDKPIKSLMLSGNIFEMLNKITGAGSDVRKVGGTVVPSLRIAGMSIVG
ncbi:TldD/PmbA family protein [Methanococcoides burtonii]|uniref:Peptidase U62 family protein n=1 Tax=Methanococcoides burtonii (strain DSM 6242 / NBRC 107633 / OCM 468 / ACE-M) TaxID=259564 RepID=Q12XJ5_METBU|nr:TldD/PmbA family protein [Methanococcoides burtonii]ABE51831.1 peptidase U62 family protein [Methanococcoides burtonii DSM 6242]